jgi:hypothetical protein
MKTELTLEALEALAAQLEANEQERREKLLRMIRAYVRILAVREPQRFRPAHTVYADEDGHYDNSYPPNQKWKRRTGPKGIILRDCETGSRATSSGFYHDLEYFTVAEEILIDADGDFHLGELTGTGRYGQFAAHPGECDVDCTLEFRTVGDGAIGTPELEDAEAHLRGLAFPLAAAVAAM